MSKPSVIVVGVVIASVAGLGALASAMGKKPPTIVTASGKVTALNVRDSRHPTLTLKTAQGQEITVRIDAKKTAITKESKAISLSNMRNGDVVRVGYEAGRKGNVAHSILVQAPAAPKQVTKPKNAPVKAARR